ncbi:Septin-like protein 2 [Elsinoe fawcettii]|nr:Septin-like protein 2 [Elsinoe fawcettii]
MDDFTPPAPSPRQPSHTRQISDVPPPLPPPPTDLPAGYRASTISQRPSTATDSMTGRRTHSRGPSREENGTIIEPTTPDENTARQRRGSFGFLSRTKSRSHEVAVVTSADGHTMLRKQKLRDQEERLRQQREAREARPPPVLPSPSPLPVINTFGGDDIRPDSVAIISNKASNFSRPNYSNTMSPSTSMPILNKQPMQQQSSPNMRDMNHEAQKGEYLDPRLRMDSMNSLRHQSLASTTTGNYHSPRRVRRRKDPTPFNILVVGAKSSGKSSLIDFLKSSLSLPPEKQHQSMITPKMTTSDGAFTSHYIEAEFDGERVGVTLWDSQGLEKNMVDLQVREMVTFIESKFEDTFTEESKVNRAPGTKDSHIHCVFLVLDPASLDQTCRASKLQANGNAFAQARGPSGLSAELDMLVMKGLQNKTSVIPIISKADTLTGPHMEYLKRSVWNSIQSEKLDPLDALGLEESEDEDASFSDSSADDHDPLPIQSTSSSISGDHKHSRLDDSDVDSGPNDGASPNAKTRSTMTTPSPGQPLKRPGSRGAARSMTPSGAMGPDVPLEDIYIPFSLLSPDPYELNAVGRRFPWGMADPYNPDHCDFVRLRDSVFSEWRVELRNASRERWYESWREQRLAVGKARMRQTGGGGVTPTSAVPRTGRAGSADAGPAPQANEWPRSPAGLGLGQRPVTSAGAARGGTPAVY